MNNYFISRLKYSCPSRFYLEAHNHLSSSSQNNYKNSYAGTWTDCRRRQNPDIAKHIPTFDFVGAKAKKQNYVYVCGFGATGALGIKKFYRPDMKNIEEQKRSNTLQSTFRRLGIVAISDKIHDIACGYGYTVIAADLGDSEHKALGFGLNTHSQIGLQSSRPGFPLEIVAAPATIFLPTKESIHLVSCGRSHTLLKDAKGKVISLGNNSFGQCGRPIIEDEVYFGSKTVHTLEGLPNNICQLECGQDHSLFLTTDGKLFSCGWGADGQTGLGHYESQWQPTQVKGDIEGQKIIKVSSCADTVMALDDQGNVFGWGNTEYAQFRILANCESEQFNVPRQLKLSKISGKVVDIAAGGTMCALLNDKGDVYVWGFGILGCGPRVTQSSLPSLIPETLFGRNLYNPEAKITQIYAGLAHFAAVSNRGDLYTWGKNRGSALGFGHGEDQYFPMRVNLNLTYVKKVSLGVDHTCALVQSVV